MVVLYALIVCLLALITLLFLTSFSLIDAGYALLKPRHKTASLTPGMRDKILAALATRFNTSVQTMSKLVHEDSIEVFGRFRQTFSEAGETVVAAGVVTITAQDSRDASFIRVSL